jgi:hypothetical protein
MARNEEEHNSQVALFQWAELEQRRYPELALMFAVPNGGLRNKVVAKKLKAEGEKAGVLDVWLPVARGGWHGLVIEMKSKKGKVEPKQKWWIENLTVQKYMVVVCYSFDEAMVTLKAYLDFPLFELVKCQY